jgi:hypothetical protein
MTAVMAEVYSASNIAQFLDKKNILSSIQLNYQDIALLISNI